MQPLIVGVFRTNCDVLFIDIVPCSSHAADHLTAAHPNSHKGKALSLPSLGMRKVLYSGLWWLFTRYCNVISWPYNHFPLLETSNEN